MFENAPRALNVPLACSNSNLNVTGVPSSVGKSWRSNVGVRATQGVSTMCCSAISSSVGIGVPSIVLSVCWAVDMGVDQRG